MAALFKTHFSRTRVHFRDNIKIRISKHLERTVITSKKGFEQSGALFNIIFFYKPDIEQAN